MGRLSQYVLAASPLRPLDCTRSDNIFGPISDCQYDFTLLFEQSVLSAVPSGLLVLLALPRLFYLYRQHEKTLGSPIEVVKIVLATLYSLLQLALLVLWSILRHWATDASITVAILNLVASILIIGLSHLECRRSLRPSTLLSGYLLFSLVLDCAQLRTLYLLDQIKPIAHVFLASWVLKSAMLIVESREKTSCLKAEYQSLPPESKSGIINRSFLWWLNELFSIGFKSIISERDLFELDPNLAAENVGGTMQEAWEKRKHSESRLALIFTVCRALYRPFGSVLLPRLCLIGFTFAQPFLISRVLSLLEEVDDEGNRMRGYGLIAATALIYVGIAISSLLASHNLFRLITMFRGGMVSLIYERTLTLRQNSFDDSAAVSLMSNDVDQIAFCLEELNECWSRLIELAIGVPLLTLQLGWVSVMPLVVFALSSGGASIVAKLIGDRQKLWADTTQKRITTTSMMLRDMSGLKMMGLTEVIGKIVQDERVRETKQMESWAWINVWQNVVSNLPFVLAPAATFGVYAIQAMMQGSASLNTVQAFTSLALITLVSYPTTRLLAAVPNLAACIGCFDRIQEYLQAESRVDGRLCFENPDPGSETSAMNENISIRLDNASIPPAPGVETLLKNVDLSIQQGSLVMITGPVGAGKTTLLKGIIGEIPCEEGSILVRSRHMAYCSQSPWLQNGTIRQAICGFEEQDSIDETWYETVLHACALDHDISNFPAGDRTVVGSRGSTLSGGQQHRVALARALYSRAKTFLLDDVLSALDKRTEKLVVNRLFGSKAIFSQLGATVIMVTHTTRYLHLAHQVVSISMEGKVVQSIPRNASPTSVLEAAEEEDPNSQVGQDDQVEKRPRNIDLVLEDVAVSNEANDLARQSGDIEVYKYYFKSIGFTKMFVFLFFCIVNVFCGCFSGIWLKWWADVGGRDIGLYLSVYLLLGFGYSAGNGGYSWAITVVIGPDTGRRLHHVLLQTVLKAPLSLFTESSAGSLLNRFSQDMSLIEWQLAIGVLITFSHLIACLAEASLVATGSPFVAFTIPLFLIAVYFVQRVYLRTSRQLRLLDIETRTPVYSHFLETIEGLSTVRAFGWEEDFKAVNRARLDNSQKPYYLLFCIQRWLSLVLDLLVAAMAVLVIALALNLRQSTSPGLLGVSLNNVLAFNVSLSEFVSGWTILETSLGAIARLRDFEKETKEEAKEGENFDPPDHWPSVGLVEIENVTAAYNASTVALQNISLKIEPGQKIAICGRTGSGKSTLLSTLLRILDTSSGTIKIDSVDLSSVPRSTIRKRLVTVPQHSLCIPGTVRLNADPFSQRSDEEIIIALAKVQLWSVLAERGGLDADFQLDSLSKGQQQQLALARAILQKSAIILLDEVTSSIDADTDRILKAIMRDEFKDCTVITVAHRPETIQEAEVVAVLDAGVLVESGVPGELMKKESRLKDLLKHTDI